MSDRVKGFCIFMPSGAFSRFVDLCEKLRQTPSKNAKVSAIAEYIEGLDDFSLPKAVLFLSGSIFSRGSGLALNVGYNSIMRSLSDIARLQPEDIQKIYLKYGDIGSLAEYAVSKKQQTPLVFERIQLSDLYDQLRKIADATGPGAAEAKRKILTGLLINCSSLEAKYLIRIASGEMRIGVVESSVELAIAKAFGQQVQAVRHAMLLSGDIAQVAIMAKKDKLSTMIMQPLTPLSFMLADVMFTPEEISNYFRRSLVCEFKYDGIRAQLHKFMNKVKIFSRRLDDVTKAFPEIEGAAASLAHDFILDGEVIAYKNGRPGQFQELQKRLRRKAITEQIMLEMSVAYIPFDIMYLDGQSLIGKPLAERKNLLSKLQVKSPIIDLGYQILSSAEEIDSEFARSRQLGHEGLVLKDQESPYQPGKRGRHWVKLKREMDTIDAVIIAAEYGHGKRAGTLSDYTFAVKDDDNEDGTSLKIIGKAYSGLTDIEIAEITAKLRDMAFKDEGYRLAVRPKIVLEVAFDSVQKSDRHDSGFALRFPRIKRIRADKTVDDIDTMDKIRNIYEMQFHQKSL
jgi:DNA ligase 1